MLSSTAGLSSRSAVLGYRSDTLTGLGKPCPHLKKGKCKAYTRETVVRHTIAREKEDELRKKATRMYALQMDLIADAGEEAELQALLDASGGAFSADPTKKAEMIALFIEELKQEPAYRQWNLEAALEEQLVREGVRRCPFTHRLATHEAMKRARQEHAKADADLPRGQRLDSSDRDRHLQVTGTTPAAATEKALAAWRAERARVFDSLTPLQRCVVCLLWQQTIHIPQHVVCDVRQELERLVEQERTGEDEAATETYLSSAAFEARVRAEEKRSVRRELCRPSVGLVDLSSLPQIAAYISQHPKCGVVRPETLAHFTGGGAGGNAETATAGPARRTVHHVAVVPGRLAEKELDLSHAPRAEECVEALAWTLHVYNHERRLGIQRRRPEEDAPAPPRSDDADHDVLCSDWCVGYRVDRVVVRSLVIQRCRLTCADGLIASLRKHCLEQHLLALDLSHNQLSSLRMLFALRAHFAERLLRLSLKNNSITRQPEYQERVRRSLPRLTSLDGEAIRHPPLSLPKPWPVSYTTLTALDRTAAVRRPRHQRRCGGAALAAASALDNAPRLNVEEHRLVMETVARHCYIWEARRIPLTDLERKAFADGAEKIGGDETVTTLPPEEELNDDNYPHRYLHPSATFSFTVVPGLSFFDPETMKLNREVELDDAFLGMRLSAHDMKDLRVFDVAMKNGSRNLLAGRPALHHFARGAGNCFLAYQCSVYPERMEVCHHLSGATVAVHKVVDPQKSTDRKTRTDAAKRPASFGLTGDEQRPALYMVHLHGVMSWRLPSMRGSQCILAAYDRTLTFTETMLHAHNFAWERRRSPQLVLSNDQLHLRPAVEGDVALYTSSTGPRLSRLLVQFGLEACRDGVTLVQAVMERTTSDAAEEATLEALVYGPLTEHEEAQMRAEAAAAGEDALPPHIVVAHATVRDLVSKDTHAPAAGKDPDGMRPMRIFSLLNRPTPVVSVSALRPSRRDREITAAPSVCGDAPSVAAPKWGGTRMHVVPLAMVQEVAAVLNAHCTTDGFRVASEKIAWSENCKELAPQTEAQA